MKRDMDLCRKILLTIEAHTQNKEIYGFYVDGYDRDVVKYHCDLLKQAGFITKSSKDILGEVIVGELTWEGQDFLDKIREDTVWNKIKEVITQKGVTLTFEIIKSVAPSIISSMVTGI